MSYRDRVTARIRHTRRAANAADTSTATAADQASEADRPTELPADEPVRDELRALRARVKHLEALVEGLQDSVHRESLRQDKRITELEARVQPAVLGKALSDDARTRGL